MKQIVQTNLFQIPCIFMVSKQWRMKNVVNAPAAPLPVFSFFEHLIYSHGFLFLCNLCQPNHHHPNLYPAALVWYRRFDQAYHVDGLTLTAYIAASSQTRDLNWYRDTVLPITFPPT